MHDRYNFLSDPDSVLKSACHQLRSQHQINIGKRWKHCELESLPPSSTGRWHKKLVHKVITVNRKTEGITNRHTKQLAQLMKKEFNYVTKTGWTKRLGEKGCRANAGKALGHKFSAQGIYCGRLVGVKQPCRYKPLTDCGVWGALST